jgi:hypothetical protein
MTNKETIEERIAIKLGLLLGDLWDAFRFFGLVLCICLSLLLTGILFFGVQL